MRKIWSSRKEKDKRKSLGGFQTAGGPSHLHLGSQSQHIQNDDRKPGSSLSSVNNTSILETNTQEGNNTQVNATTNQLNEKNPPRHPTAFETQSIYEQDFADDHSTLHETIGAGNASVASTTNGVGNASIMSSGITTNAATSNTTSGSASTPRIRSVAGLAKTDYDTKVLKNSWLNVIVNLHSVGEISENTMKMYRAELKGLQMYLYKAPSTSIRAFRVGPGDDPALEHSQSTTSLTSFSNTAPLELTPTLELFRHGNGSNLTIHEAPTPTTAGPAPEVLEYAITYFDATVPHPSLQYDFEQHQFVQNRATVSLSKVLTRANTVEALLHFVFFVHNDADHAAVQSVLSILPILPNFGQVLRLAWEMLTAILAGKYAGDVERAAVVLRALDLLDVVKREFHGYLLKSDVAPYILRLLEACTDQGADGDRVGDFKREMLQKQQTLIGLVSQDAPEPSSLPFVDLNANAFMNDVNLFDFAASVSAIDLKFFNNWNSNIDKSLLLRSSLNLAGPAGPSPAEFFYKKNTLIFNNDVHIHYLSRLLVSHLFEGPQPTTTAGKLSSEVLERKARLLEKWIDLGCLLDKSGNMSSWLGISSIILSQPVLRLIKVWLLVLSDYIKLLKNDWLPVLFELDRRYLANGLIALPEKSDEGDGDLSSKDLYHIMAPRGLGKIYPKESVIPYFGDLVINNTASSSVNILELESIWKRINYSFSRWNEYLANLSNHTDIIRFNDDVLRRYDLMGFIFLNESLNQVLYLGSNSDDTKLLPPAFHDATPRTTTHNAALQNILLKLIEVNCDLINLDKIMRLSLALEPELPEAYLRLKEPTEEFRHRNSSSISIHSNDSSTSLHTPVQEDPSPASRLPTFNNSYFKLSMYKYDDLVGGNNSSNENKVPLQQMLDPQLNKHNVYIDDELTFRIDDFVSDFDSNSTVLDDVDHVDDEDDVPGLGIDVDDILNSEKFKNFTMSPNPNKKDKHERKDGGDARDSERPKSTSSGTGEKKNYSVISSDSGSTPTKYIPKFASVDKLIDLLLIDSKYFDENISLDLTEYRFVFLLNYNTFITTKDLLDKLAHRFINLGNAVISVMKKLYIMRTNNKETNRLSGYPTSAHAFEFPNWALDTDVDLNVLGEVDYELLLKIQINILKVLIVLVNNFYLNFAVDLANKTILIKLLKLFSNEILQWYNSKKIDATLEKSFESLVNYYKKLKKLFVKKTYRPVEVSKFEEYLITEFRFSNSLHEVPMNRNLPGHKNIAKIEKFLHKFNKLLAVFYTGIKAEDWVKVYKILEHAFEKNALFEFNLQKNTTTDDNLIVSNIFTMFESLVDPQEKQLVLKKLPLVFRKLFKIYFKFRSYLLVQLTDLNITVEERLDRMKTLLLMVQISKLKMSENQFVFEGTKDCIPSCIETAITNVIYSPESRLFTNLWAKASNSLNEGKATSPASYDDLKLLIPSFLTTDDLQSTEPLLPCFGWIIEILLETNMCPSFYKDIINFNKRYLIFKLIKELGVEDPDSQGDGHEVGYHDTREFDFLLNLDETLINNQSLRDFTFLDKDKLKLFRSVLRDQRRILIVDNKKKQIKDNREALAMNMNNSTQSLNSTASSNTLSNSTTGNSLNKKSSSSSLRRQSLSYKSNSSSRFKISGLFTKSRPFSLNVSSANERVVNARELPPPENFIDAKQKPFLVILLKNKKVFPVYLLPLSFKIDSDVSNEDYFFQAPSETDLNDWMVKLNYANRHWFFSRQLNLKTSNLNTTFGIPIEVICNREQSQVPRILSLIFAYIEEEGIKDVGVYRISSSISELANVKTTIDKAGYLDFEGRGYDVHTLTSVVKSFFRELPDALLTDMVIEQLLSLKQTENDDEKSYREILMMLPAVNYYTLKLLVSHLRKILQHSETNKMTPSNLATVIGPALTEASLLELLINNFGFMNSIMEKLITNYEEVFEDVDEETERN